MRSIRSGLLNLILTLEVLTYSFYSKTLARICTKLSDKSNGKIVPQKAEMSRAIGYFRIYR